MINLSFDDGTYKEYQLNGKETIRVNVGDPGIIDRLKGCDERIDQIRAELGDGIEDNLGKLDKEIRKMVDDVLNCPGACDKAFGNTHCLAIAGGKPIILNFLQVLTEQITKDIKQTVSAVKINESIKSDQPSLSALDNERTQKYITQSTPHISQPTQVAPPVINIAALSQAERERLLAELIGETK